MFDLLELENFLPDTTSSEYQKQLQAVDPYCEKIKAAFSRQFLDEFWDELDTLYAIHRQENFLSGLRLGAQLTYQLLLQPLPKRPRP